MKNDWKQRLENLEKLLPNTTRKRWATPSAIALRKLLDAGKAESDAELMAKYKKVP
jgi:hypothetical protein